MRQAWRFLSGFGVAVALFGAGGLAVVETGAFNTSASDQHSELVAWATHTTMMNSIRRRAPPATPQAHFTQSQVDSGLRLYETHCLFCHGGPGVDRDRWTSGLNPTPPFLLDAARQWTAPQLQLIIAGGVKMTAMPAWKGRLSDEDIRDLVAFLEALPDIPPRSLAAMRSAEQKRLESAPTARTPPT